MATAHLIVGSTGAGKTTYALKLAEATGAIRFTIDEWMAGLFFPDAPEPLSHQWALERVIRCENQILSMCSQTARAELDVILDLGFFTREQRERIAMAARGLGLETRLHYLPVAAEVRWERVNRRNTEKTGTYEIEVTRGMFDFCEDLFETPTADELEGAIIVE